MSYTKSTLLDAVNLLVSESDPRYMLEAIEATFSLRQYYPVRLGGPLVDLNAVIELREEDPEKWLRVQTLIDSRRLEAGLPLGWPPKDKPAFDKKAYQRRLMAHRREWSGRAADIENLQREDRDKLKGTRRLDYERRQIAAWGAMADERVAAHKRANGGKISREEINAIKGRLWDEIDASLDEREAAVRAELMKPAHLRKKL